MSAESPFQISISDSQITLLRQKLALTNFPDELEDAGWSYGSPLADVQRLVNRWKDGYDWRKHEAQLNAELPQFTRDIDVDGFGTINIHYVHKRSDEKNAIPLLFVHGCASVALLRIIRSQVQRRRDTQGQEASLRSARSFRCWWNPLQTILASMLLPLVYQGLGSPLHPQRRALARFNMQRCVTFSCMTFAKYLRCRLGTS
jgi:Epoxide hydrolase N terminus